MLPPTLVGGCLEGKWPAQGLPLAVLGGDQVHLQTQCPPKLASQCLSGNPAHLCPLFSMEISFEQGPGFQSSTPNCPGVCGVLPARTPQGFAASITVLFLGKFAIRADKKSNPVVRTVKSVGMIAGGTGEGRSPG